MRGMWMCSMCYVCKQRVLQLAVLSVGSRVPDLRYPGGEIAGFGVDSRV